jgi:hypothetical protein
MMSRCYGRRLRDASSRTLPTDCSFHDGGRISTLPLRGKKEGSHGLLCTKRRQVLALSIILPISLSRAVCFASGLFAGSGPYCHSILRPRSTLYGITYYIPYITLIRLHIASLL